MGAEENGRSFGWCNLIIKYLLFLTNVLIWLVGMAILALGIYIQVDQSLATIEQDLMLGQAISAPAIFLIVIGALLFIIGFCGCFGALLEIFFLLVIYSILLSVVVLVEIGLVIFVVVQEDQAYDAFASVLNRGIELYYNDTSVRGVVNLIQRDFVRCCGVTSPDDWQANIYFNCSSIAFQRCSVPPSCCMIQPGEIINQQCGYQTLDSSSPRFKQGIHTVGCLSAIQELINSNLYVALGVGIGLLVFQILCVLLASGLAVDVHREKKFAKAIKKQEKLERQAYEHTSKM